MRMQVQAMRPARDDWSLLIALSCGVLMVALVLIAAAGAR